MNFPGEPLSPVYLRQVSRSVFRFIVMLLCSGGTSESRLVAKVFRKAPRTSGGFQRMTSPENEWTAGYNLPQRK